MSESTSSRSFLAEAQARLRRQRQDLRERIAAELGDSRHGDQATLATEVHDRGEESLLDALAGVHYAGVAHDLEEARDVEAALARIAAGSYGSCVDCTSPIAEARLAAYPTAKRCRSCQERYEARDAAGLRRQVSR
jgi:DnaK suppressor protein